MHIGDREKASDAPVRSLHDAGGEETEHTVSLIRGLSNSSMRPQSAVHLLQRGLEAPNPSKRS
jgi:hypothetical protein